MFYRGNCLGSPHTGYGPGCEPQLTQQLNLKIVRQQQQKTRAKHTYMDAKGSFTQKASVSQDLDKV